MRTIFALALLVTASGASACDFDSPYGGHMAYLRSEDSANNTAVADQAWDRDANMSQARSAFIEKFKIDTTQDAKAEAPSVMSSTDPTY